MKTPGSSRRQIARTLNAAYANGLLSEETFAARVDQLLCARVIDSFALTGDLYLRSASWLARLRTTALATVRRVVEDPPALLALDWTGGHGELLIGRSHSCDVVLADLSVSRRHARLFFRDGRWILQDLASTNGTLVNGVRVGRCVLQPGDRLALGDHQLQID